MSGRHSANLMPTDSADVLSATNKARLPDTYQHAKSALAECSNIDECKDWADKAAALASYAKQSKDTEMRKMCDRIQARAIRRCGELLREFDARPENGKKKKQSIGEGTLVSQESVAKEAGLSKRQQTTAVRVANVPTLSFERQVESETPPTVTALAEQGKRERPKPIIDLGGRDEKDFAAATQSFGELRRFAEFCAGADWKRAKRGAFDHEIKKARGHAEAIVGAMENLLEVL
jgi:hypothetical protein